MVRAINRLAAIDVPRIAQEGLHNDGNGLYLKVTKSGSKSWVLKYGVGGKMRAMGLGSFPAISLAVARKLATDQRQKLSGGTDPIEARKAARASGSTSTKPTFLELSEKVIELKRPTWVNAKSEAAWELTLLTYARGLHDRPIDTIEQHHVEELLLEHWQDRPETARRLRGRIDAVWKYAIAKKYLPRDAISPAKWGGYLAQVMPKQPAPQHHPAMPYKAVPDFMAGLHKLTSITALCLRFIVLTGVRSNEARGAFWNEIEAGDAKLWTIPEIRTKTKRRPHIVPLSNAAMGVLHGASQLRRGDLIFEGNRENRPLTDTAFAKLNMGEFTVHGFRSTFADWARETTDFDDVLIELALGHSIGSKVEKAYKRGVLVEKRRELMDAWGAFCESKIIWSDLSLRAGTSSNSRPRRDGVEAG